MKLFSALSTAAVLAVALSQPALAACAPPVEDTRHQGVWRFNGLGTFKCNGDHLFEALSAFLAANPKLEVSAMVPAGMSMYSYIVTVRPKPQRLNIPGQQ
ncbi:MAG: hypothetical protein AAB919_02175 [Patescibacteria group bacterium]